MNMASDCFFVPNNMPSNIPPRRLPTNYDRDSGAVAQPRISVFEGFNNFIQPNLSNGGKRIRVTVSNNFHRKYPKIDS